MIILAHRGFWEKTEEKNSVNAFTRAFKNHYGIETDIRDFNGSLVISHNMPDENSPLFIEMLEKYKEYGAAVPLALNIKADGIQPLLKKYLKKYNVTNYFVFDMSVPEQVVYIKDGFRTYTRQSEFEQSPVMYENSEGLWMDEFRSEWMTEEIIREHLISGKKVGIVSPEIHGNDEMRIWKMLKQFNENNNLMLCTDIPRKAEVFFNGED